ncbi:TPA: Rho termination factor N-terminal domain-containing protein [Streptococcus agalactiae]|nr:Rho termination factor N-terminal domain-containing protein [Streptococcus agalactiae]HEO5205436.1 Rho termination factor N-terminal domain-containing protein [Streptococcus agalactiae]HEO6848337.1 Rho termination factor N-terminal domain-containing protein [Streptococcus agalactiae]HEO6998886.1 Rho termination factor N-terminal domain-containing protein [Streptococcus agalactiae]HEO7007157.1 Rho termination factor N-terminal domain-containing protein [Streptococcus agalactiae]
MAYTVKARFFDLLDNSFLYEVGDIFPRKGYEPSKERLESLLSSNNAYHKPFISASESLHDMKVTELKEKAKDLGIELPAKANKEEIIELIEKK